MTNLTSTGSTAYRPPIASHPTELRAALEEQRVFRVEQLTELAAEAARPPALSVYDARDEVTDALRAGATKAMSDIEAAIARMEAGRYGACETCNGEIPLERLEILPMAALCMPCARAQRAS
jgi:DnaK suppressor protein